MSPLAEALDLAREARDLLSGGAFSQETAADLDGSGLDLRDCRFQSCRFRDCDFSGAAFYSCVFTDCLMENCRLPGTYWKDCRLSGCKWDGADLRRSRWKDSALEETFFRYVNFTGGFWERISVKVCDFTESALSEMQLKKVILEKADLSGAEAVPHQPRRHGPDGLHPGPDRAVGDLPGAEGGRHQRRPGRGGSPDPGHRVEP